MRRQGPVYTVPDKYLSVQILYSCITSTLYRINICPFKFCTVASRLHCTGQIYVSSNFIQLHHVYTVPDKYLSVQILNSCITSTLYRTNICQFKFCTVASRLHCTGQIFVSSNFIQLHHVYTVPDKYLSVQILYSCITSTLYRTNICQFKFCTVASRLYCTGQIFVSSNFVQLHHVYTVPDKYLSV